MIPRYYLDANVVLRFLRNDDPRQSPAAAKLFASAKAGKAHLLLSDVTVAEVFYVLARIYKHSRADVSAKLSPFVHSDAVDVENRERVLDAMQRVAKANVDFGDGYLASAAAERGDKVASFDADLQSFPDIISIVPQ